MRLFARLEGLSGRRHALAAVALGALSALSLPPVTFVPALLIAIPGLLALLRGRSWRAAALTGFWFGFGQHVPGLYWITDAILVEADTFWWVLPFAVPGLAAVLALFVAATCALAQRFRDGWPRVLALAGLWGLADLARQFVATGFPWNPLGSAWEMPGAAGDWMIQPAALIGVHGLTVLTLLLAATPALGRRAMAGGLAGLLAWGGFGAWRVSQPALPAPKLDVVLVQGNVPETERFGAGRALGNFERHLDLTRQGVAAAAGTPTVVMWPETASPYLLVQDANARAAVAAAADGPALIGTVRFDAAGRPRNSLVALNGPGPPVAIYDKAHLVPFGEYEPSWIPLAFNAMPRGGFAAGPGPQTIVMDGIPPVGALICYEVIFPGAVIDAVHRPAWMANITNDAWFGNSSGPRQHLAAARMRAVEEGLPLMRAANTGISAGFDAHGHELGRIGMLRQGVLVLPLPGPLPATPFARFGLWLPFALCGVLLAGAAGLTLRRRHKNENM
jgi:apolipoprotein N-acyltransferase